MQELFNEYKIHGDLENIDSFLCDHYSIERFFHEYQNGWTIRWYCNDSLTSWESTEMPNFHENNLVVSYKPELSVIEIYKQKVYQCG